jgi:hypothetical protein
LQAANDDDLATSSGAFAVLQGACVGGGGTVNNAICLQLPEARLADWQRHGFPIQTADMRAAYAVTAQELESKPISAATRFFNPVGQLLQSLGPVRQPPVDVPPAPGLYEAWSIWPGESSPAKGWAWATAAVARSASAMPCRSTCPWRWHVTASSCPRPVWSTSSWCATDPAPPGRQRHEPGSRPLRGG